MQPQQWSFVPEFSTDIILENARTSGLPRKNIANELFVSIAHNKKPGTDRFLHCILRRRDQ
jgi:hypothetical protein